MLSANFFGRYAAYKEGGGVKRKKKKNDGGGGKNGGGAAGQIGVRESSTGKKKVFHARRQSTARSQD